MAEVAQNSKAEPPPGDNNNANNVVGNATAAGDTVPADGQAAGQQEQQQNRPNFFAMVKSLVVRMLIIYLVTSFFRRPSPAQQPVGGSTGPDGQRIMSVNVFQNGTLFDLHVWLSESANDVDWHKQSYRIWLQEDLVYGDWNSGPTGDGIYTHSVKIKATPQLMNNGSLYLHTFVTRAGESPNPRDENYGGLMMAKQSRRLNKFKKIRVNRNYNLLSGDKEKFAKELEAAELKNTVLSHWHPNLTINVVTDYTNWTPGTVPAPLDQFIKFVDSGKRYLPILFLNDYWNLQREYFPINETTPELDLHLTYQPMGLFKWQLYAAQQLKSKMTGNFLGEIMAAGQGDDSEDESDSLKETMLETNVYLLGITIAVSLFHSVFELLAFKNDIQFWNNRQSLEGLSVRSVFFGVVQSVIVLLYVMDNETNFMIRLSCMVGLGIEVWKIHKVVDIKYNTEDRILGIFPRLSFEDKGSYEQSHTKEYDQLAFKYLGMACFPLLIAYFVYSLLYNEHKGWYSFFLNMLYGYLLTFGFIMMTPQLFINYKLKSVAHMPWRMMTYKFLNTFIDDIFAFVIKMPTMYRLGCFRDDLIFFVFLYQRWVYRVDPTRVNEFGFSGEMEQGAQPQAIAPGDAPAEVEANEAPPAVKTDEEKKQD